MELHGSNNHPSTTESNDVVAAILQDARVAPNLQDKDGTTPLASATLKSHFNIVATLLEDARINPNLADDKGYTPLHHAVETINFWEPTHIIEALLKHDQLNPNLKDKKHGYTALARAVLNDNYAVFKILQKNTNVDINLPENQGRTPFFLATTVDLSAHDSFNVFKALLADSRVAHHQPTTERITAFQNVLMNWSQNSMPGYMYAQTMLNNAYFLAGAPNDLIALARERME